jgi:multidrug efflux system outer membrane protein
MEKKKYVILFCLCLLTACSIGPSYRPSMVMAPKSWKGEHTEKLPLKHFNYWWEIFEDDDLNYLEQQVLKHNNDLAKAIECVQEARSLAGISRSELFPQVNLKPNYKNFLGLLFFPIPGAQDIKRTHMIYQQLPVNVSYEIDIWGKIQNQYLSAFQNAQSIQASSQVVFLTLTTDLAASYFKIRCLDRQINILENTIQVDKEDLALNEINYKGGLVNLLSVTYARQSLANDESTLLESKKTRVLEVNKIGVLIGKPASCVCLKENPVTLMPPKIPAGLPSQILLTRPDIWQAERKMASEHALINVAYASFYPSFDITGSLGYASPDLSQFLTWPGRFWYIGTNINQILFDGGRLDCNLSKAKSKFKQSCYEYQQVVLNAFREVEDALSSIELEDLQLKQLQIALDAANQTVEISSQRYNKGIGTAFEVFNAKKTALATQERFNSLLSLRYFSSLSLIKALGGRFNIGTDNNSYLNESIFKKSECKK